LNFIKKVFKEKGYFRYSDLGKELVKTGRSYDLAGNYLEFFLKQKKIKKIKRGVYTIDKY